MIFLSYVHNSSFFPDIVPIVSLKFIMLGSLPDGQRPRRETRGPVCCRRSHAREGRQGEEEEHAVQLAELLLLHQ